jgi:GAF domain-containing protein
MSNDTSSFDNVANDPLQVLKAQYEASGTIYGSSDPAEILDALIEFGNLRFAYAHLALAHPQFPDTFRVVAEHSGSITRSTLENRQFHDYPAWESLSAVELLSSEDVVRDPFFDAEERQRIIAQGFAAFVIVPLIVGQRLTGLFFTSNPDPAPISQTRIRALRSLADQVAVVFENQRLDTEKDLLDYAIRAMVEAFSADHGGLMTFTEKDGTVIYDYGLVVAEHPISGAMHSRLQMSGNPYMDALLATSKPIIVNDVMNDPRTLPDTREVFRGLGIFSLMLVPVIVDQQVVVSMGLDLYSPDKSFSQESFELAQTFSAQVSVALQNVRRSARLQQQVAVQSTLTELATSITRFKDEKALFDYVAEALAKVMQVDHIGVLILEESGEFGAVVSEYPSMGAVGIRLAMAENPLFNVAMRTPESPLLINDLRNFPHVNEQTRLGLMQLGIESIMLLPLFADGKLLGSIGFDMYTLERFFTPEMLQMGQTIGAQLTLAVQNIRLLRDAQRRAEQLERIAEFSRLVSPSQPLGDIVEIMLDESRGMLETDLLQLYLHDGEELRLSGQYVRPNAPDAARNAQRDLNAIPSKDEQIVYQTWTSQESLFLQNALDRPLQTTLAIPVRGSEQHGVMIAACVRPFAFSQTDRTVYQQIVNQFAVTLENYQGYVQNERAARYQTLLNNLTERYQRTLGVEEMLNFTLREIGSAIGAKHARARLGLQADFDLTASTESQKDA